MKKQIVTFIVGIAAWVPIQTHGSELLPIVYSDLGQLCSTNPSGTNRVCVKSRKEIGSPSWQPNGDRIVAETGYHDGAHDLALLKKDILLDHFKKMLLVTVHEDHFQAIKTLPKDYSYVSEAVWVDEKNLLFIGKKNESRGELWKLNVDSEKLRNVGVPGLWLRDFITLSPDRKSVIVCAMPDEDQTKWSLWRYNLGFPRAERLTTGTEDVSPAWRH